jgi:transposase
MQLLIGIDWSQDHHHVCFMNSDGGQQADFQIEHTMDGFAKLDDKRAKFGVPATDCLVALETAHNLVVDFLWSRQYIVYVIAPGVVKSCRGRFGSSGAYTDASSAHLLADLLRTDRRRFVPWLPDSTLTRQMRARLSLVEALRRDINRWSNRLRAVMLRYHPQMVGLFGKLTTQVSLQCIITYPTSQAMASLDIQAWSAFCHRHGYRRTDWIAQTHARLQVPAPQPDPVAVQAYQDEAIFVAQLLLSLLRQRKQLLREVSSWFKQHPDSFIFDSLPGTGELLGPSLLVKYGDRRERFPRASAVQALAGTCPVTLWSGKKRRIAFRKACDRDFRRIAQQFAIASVKQSLWAATYWQEVRPRCDSDSHAYRCLANRWLAIIWKMWHTRQPYDEEYHLRQRLLRRKPRSYQS